MIEEEHFNGEGPAPKVDEDWKSQVQHEREAPRTASGEQSDGADQSAPGLDYSKLPPADFSMLVSMFATQAMVALGVIPEPTSGKPRTQLPLARHFINLLGVLEEKTKGNLTERESESLVENLHPLRMMYLEMSKRG